MSRDSTLRALQVAATGGDPLALQALEVYEARQNGARLEDDTAMVLVALDLLARARFDRVSEDLQNRVIQRGDHWESCQYREQYSSLAREAVEEIAGQGHTTHDEAEEALMDYIRESVDRHPWVIYYHLARKVIVHSDNRDAYENVYGDEMPSETTRAYCALERDTIEDLDTHRSDCETCDDDGEVELDGDWVTCPDCGGRKWTLDPIEVR